jgi:hypothetical protein
MFDIFTSRNVKKKSFNIHSHVRPNTEIVGLRECWLSNLSDILGGICRTWEFDRWYTWSVLYVQVVNTSCLVQKLWMESPCMFKLSVLHVWFKTFGWKHPVCSACLLDIWFKNFGLNHPVCLICQYFMSGSKFWMESSCKFNLSDMKQVWE